MPKYIKLFESFSDDQRDFLKSLRPLLGLEDQSDLLEFMLGWAARQFELGPDEISIKQVDDQARESMLQGRRSTSRVDLEAFGMADGGIHQLVYVETNTPEEYAQLRDEVQREHPELRHDTKKNLWARIQILRRLVSQQYGVVVAWGPAGNFVLTPHGRDRLDK